MHKTDGNGDWIAREWKSFTITAALQGFVGGWGVWYDDALVSIERTGRFIAGTWAPEAGEDGPRPGGDGTWTRFVGRIGAVALRAAAPSTRPARREVLLNFLESWAESPFADPSYRFRIGRLAAEGPFGVRGASGSTHGAAVATYWPVKGKRRLLEARTGDDAPGLPGELLYAEDAHRGWGGPEQLRRLVALVRERGPMPWDPAAVVELSDACGISRPAAALTLAGNPGAGGYYTPFLDKDERAALGLKTAEAESGRAELGRLRDADRVALLADVLPEDPADLWEPGGLRRVAARTAEAWREQQGVRPRPPEQTWQAALALETRIPATDLCHLFLDPARAPLPPGFYLRVRPCPPEHRALRTVWDVMGFPDANAVVDAVFTGLPWAYADLPAGDPVRDGAPEVVRVMREVLARKDSPAKVLYAGVVDGSDGSARWDWLTGGACDRMMDRITTGDLPPGRYESDPRACAPALVAEVADRLGLTEDAAALYLQLLTLPVPSDRNVRRWNGWAPARHRAAVGELVGRGLVVEDKRARAGRSVFLPGPWAHAAKPLPPMELWKASLLGAVLTGGDGVRTPAQVRAVPPLPGTLPELFAAAWQRVRNGEGPSASAA
ncbi:hypothetical protein [Streptomyces nondiastaticus]|uniref:DNA-binding protein n=1 Tax=Streptomyces nondiastaticus TaxID=3154512 RepID=A0ABW6U1I8_9ACTN